VSGMQGPTTTEEVSIKPVDGRARRGWAGLLTPSLTDIFFAGVLLWFFLCGGGKALLGDGDTAWHIRTGDYILQNHAVPHQDIFTFTRPDAPWFAWEWLSDVLFSKVHSAWGVKSVALLAGCALCAMARVLSC